MPNRCEQCGQRCRGRADARYCSASCRQRAYRERKRRPDGPGVSERVAELARLAGELDDWLVEYCYPRSRIPRPEAAEHLVVSEHDVLMATRAQASMNQVYNVVVAIATARRDRQSRNATVTDVDAYTDLDA